MRQLYPEKAIQILNKGLYKYKKILLSFSIILFTLTLNSQTWDGGAATTNWNDALNWSGDVLPVAGNDVVINTALTIANVPSISLNSLSVTRNVTLQSAAGATIVINNTTATPALSVSNPQILTLGGGTAGTAVNLIFQNITGAPAIAGTLVNSGNNTITINNGQTVPVTGTLTNSITGTIFINGTLNNSGLFNANAGTITVNGTINNSGTVTGTAANLTFTAGAIYVHNQNGGSIPLSLWAATSNCNVSGLTNTTLAGGLNQAFGNLTLNSGGLSAGLTLTLTGNMSVQGNLLIQGTAVNTLTLAPAANSLTVTGTTTINSNGIFNDIIGGTNTFNGDVNVNGIWNGSASAVTMAGNLTVNSGATFNSGAGVYTLSGTGRSIGGTIAGITITSVSVTGTLDNNLATLTIPSLAILGTLTNRTGQTITCNTLLSGAGSFIQEANATLNLGGNATISTLTAIAAGNNVNYTFLGLQNILPVNYYNLRLGGNNTKTITGPTLVSGILNFNGAATLAIGANALTAASVNRVNPIAITIAAGSFTVNSGLLLALTDAITFSAAGTLNISGDLTCGTLTASSSTIQVSGNFGPNALTANTGTVNLNGASPQQINGGYTFNILTLSGGGNKVLTANTNIAAALNLTSGVLQLGNFNLVFTGIVGPAAITGIPSATSMIETNGTGVLRFTSGALPNAALNGTYPIGYNGTYNPVVVSGLPVAAVNHTFNIRVVPGQLFVNGVNRYWEIQTNVTGTPTLSFKYNASEALGDITKFQPFSNLSGSWALAPTPSAQGVNPVTSTTAAALPAISLWTAGMPGAFYSYQTGNWNNPTTWTYDPSGSTLINPLNAIPGYLDVVNILTSRTVLLTANVATTDLDITINESGFLDLSTYNFTNGLKALSGQGTLRLASVIFPTPIATNNFITALGGTTEYYNSANFSLPAVPVIYNHLTINTGSAVATQTLNTLTLNGDLHVKSGTFCINDGTAARRTLIINGNVTVDNGASITVGNGVTNSTTIPTAVGSGGAAPYIDYYNTQSHRIDIYGDFTNNGTVRFTNLPFPVYNAFPPTIAGATTGFATVYFRGSTNNTLTCNNTTDFYNLVLDKGVDQTFSLTVYSSAYKNFRLFGANIAVGENATANPNLRKALWIRTGTLYLKGLTVIPSLSEGTIAGPPSSDYFIPANGALVLDGHDVVVLSTADDYREVNAAYNLAGGTGLINGIGVGGYSALSILGKLQVNNGYLSTRESAGITYWTNASGQFIINGGTVDAKQFRDALAGNTGLISYVQNGGTFNLRGRFQRDASPYSGVSDLVNAALNTTRSATAIDGTTGTFSINTNVANGYSMAGGTISIFDVCGNTAAPYLAFQVGCALSDINVTGGTVQILPITGTGADATNYIINSTAPFANLDINRISSTSAVQLNANPLTVLKNLSLLGSAVFDANNLDVTIGGNFSIAAGTSYSAGTNNTVFNGTGTQLFTVNLAGPLALNNLKIDKASADALVFAGSQNIINVNNTLTLSNGRLGDNGNTINVTGNIFNSGTHYGTGKIVLNGTNPQIIDGDGNGIFNNIDINNTNAAAAPVSLSAGITVTGTLQLVANKILNIADNPLKIKASATIASTPGFSNTCFIQTKGLAGDGGITKDYSALVPSFVFPIGAPTITPVHAAAWTPATITINGTPASFGSITVVPVGIEHPNTTNKGRSLTYYWRVKSGSGFSLGSATASHSYVYDTKDIVTGGTVTENEYVPARYDQSGFVWAFGTNASINTGTHTMAGPWLSNTTTIDGEYTAGDNNPTNPFGTSQILYSRQSGLWSNVNNWSTTGHTVNNPPALPPGPSDIVIIGGNDSIYLQNFAFVNKGTTPPGTYYPLNTPGVPVSCASLQIEKGSALDIENNPACNFGVVRSHPNGNGNFRLATSYATGTFYVFPLGDFSDFNVNIGTTEFYTVNPEVGPYFILPANASSYGTVILTPLGGSNLILPNLPNVTIYGDLICRGQDWESWLAMSWNGTYGAVVPKTVHVKKNLDLQGGSFVYALNGATAQTIIIDGDLKIAPFAGVDIYSATNNIMFIGGNLINNSNNGGPALYGGWAGSNARFYRDANNKIDITFFGPNSASVTNNPALSPNPNTTFGKVTVNKGTSQATTLTIDISGALTTLTDNWLTLQNGTLQYIRNGDLNITTGSTFSIPSTSGLYIKTPNSIFIGNNNVNNNDLFLSGKLTLAVGNTGNVYIGQPAFPNNNNDIEYSSGGSSAIEVNGGNLFVNGQIRRNPSNAGGILSYTQTGGTVTINGNNAVTGNAKLEVLNAGSQFNMSGGTLTLVRGGGTTFGDLYLRPQTSAVSNGTIILSQGGIAASQTYLLESNVPLNNLVITGGAAAIKATAKLMISPLVLNGNLTLSNTNSVLDATNFGNSIDITLNGNLINSGGIASYIYGTNTTTFSASNAPPYLGAQSLTGATGFYNLEVNPGASLTINNNITVNHDLSIGSGTLNCVTFKADVAGNFTNNGNYTDSNAPGTGISLNGTTIQQLEGSGTFGRLELNNLAGAKLNSSISLQEELVMNRGIFDVNTYLLTLGVNSDITVIGVPFGVTKMITTQGVFSNIGLKKFFSTVTPKVFTYPIGTAGKYTPAVLTINANSYVGSIRINNINATQPAIIDPANALKYYWEVESSGISGFTGNVVFNYLPGDVAGSQESNYLAARLIVPGTSWSITSGVTPASKTITFNYINSLNLCGEYTAGVAGAFPPNVPTFTSIADGNWNDNSIWNQTGGTPYALAPGNGPNGFIVIVNHNVTANANFCSAYKTTINGRLKIVTPFYGHNLGTVTGNGTLYLENGAFPAGVFTTFLDCDNNATIEYGGTGTYSIIADLYDNVPNLLFSGTGTRVLPDKDLTICKSLKIGTLTDGPILDNSVYNRKLIIEGTMERYNSGTFNSGTGAGAIVEFAGLTPQVIGGATGNFDGANAFNNMEVNNTLGLTVNGSTEVSGNLLLTDGLINTTLINKLTLVNSAINCVIPAGGTAASFVNGPLTKKINQGDNFFFPIGQGTIPGNKISLSASQTGTILWTAQYFNPNGTFNSYAPPLSAVSWNEYWKVTSPSGNGAIVNLDWDPTSDITPLVTLGGKNDIRVAWYNTGTGKWNEIPSNATGNNYNGTVSTTGRITIPASGSSDFTMASVTTLIPKAKLTPTGPVCGVSGVPVTFSAPVLPVPPNYKLTYTVDGGAPQSVVITPAMLPYKIPTNPVTSQIILLTGFSYNTDAAGAGGLTGVVDATAVTAYANPTIAIAGAPQSWCGITSANLNGSVPIIGTGVWSIVPPNFGGTVITPTSPTSQFNGLNGRSYTLKWKISNGTCTSSSNTSVSFTLLPDAPVAAANQTLCAGAVVSDIVATTPTGTVNWFANATGGAAFPGTTTIVSGTNYFGEVDNGCISETRTQVTVTINNPAAPTGSASQYFCAIDNPTVADLTTATGSGIKWYTAASGGIALLSTDALITGNYYASQTVGLCESVLRFAVSVTVDNQPAPIVGAITQPTCVVATGSAPLSGLPAAGTWTVTESPGSLTMTGTGTTGSFIGLTTGTHTFTVTNAAGCMSPASGNAVINAQPPSPNPTLTSSDADNSFCSGTSVTFTAGGGTSYNFRVAGASVQSGASTTYTTTALTNLQVVDVIVTNAGGCTATSTGITNTVLALPNPTLTSSDADNSFCSGTSVTFTAGGGTSYNFRVAGASVQSGASTTYTTTSLTNLQVVDVIVTNAGGCTATSTGITNTVLALPNPTLTSSDADNSFCSGTSVTFTAGGGTSYNFRVAGASVQSGASTTYTTTALTNLQVVDVIVTNAGGCTATSTGITNTVLALPNPTLTSSDADNSFCSGTSVTFTAGGGTSYNFRVAGASVQSGASTTYTTTALTNLQVVDVIVTNAGGCTATSTGITNTVLALPNPTLSSSDADNSFCSGTSVTFTAGGGTSYNFRVAGASVQSGASTTYTTTALTNLQVVDVIVTNAGGCTATSTGITNTVLALPNPTLTSSDADNSFCSGTSVTFTAGGGTSYNFRVAGASVQSGASTTYTTTALTNLQVVDVIVTNAGGCTATSTGITNTVLALPNPTLSSSDADNSFCSGTSVTFTAGGGTSYNFRVAGASVQSGASTTYNTTALTNLQVVDVIVTNAGGCTATSTGITNTVLALPNPTLTSSDADNSFCSGTSVTFTAGGGTSYNFRVAGASVQSGASTTYTTTALTNLQVVDVIVTNAGGCTATSTGITNTVLALPNPTLSSSDADNSFCSGTSVTFTAGGGTSYNFRVAGASVQSGASTTYTTTALTNLQVVDVIVTNASGCTATSTGITNTVLALPTPTLTSSDADNSFCSGTSVTFTAGGGTSYNFRVAGASVQSGASTTYTTTALTNLQVVDVIVTNAGGCTATSTGITNTVLALPNPTLSSSDADNSFCSGTSVTFTAGGGTSYNFRVAGASVQSGASTTYTTTALTNLQVVDVIVTNAGGCTATSTGITNTVLALPNPTLTSSDADNSFCSGTSVTFTAGGGTSYDFRVAGASVQSGASTTYTTTSLTNLQVVDVIVTNAGGCTATSTGITNTVLALPNPTLTSSDADNSFCSGTSVTFTAGGGTSYNFRVAGASVQSGASTTYTTTALTNLQVVDVIVTNAGGCTATSTGITNTVLALPNPTLTSSDADNSFCSGTSVTFTAGGGTSYNFRVAGASVQSGASTTYTTTALTNLQVVDVIVTNAGGCTATSTGITNTVLALPNPTLSSSDADNSFCSGTSVTFTAGGGTSYNFRVAGASVQSGASTTYTTTALTNLQVVDVIVTNAGGCTATSTGITNTVLALPNPTLSSSDADNSFCSGTSVTFTAGGGTSYNFRVAGASVQSGASTTYTTTSLTNLQVVDVIVTNASGCTATSTGITNTVLALPNPTLTSSDADNSFCSGTSVTFTAGGGTSYNFRVAGASVQSGASTTYTTTALTNLQVVDVIVTNAGGCTATSTGITNTVLALPNPTLTSSDADNSFCSGTSVTFTAGGGTSYNFRVAGASVQSGASTTYTTTALTNLQVVDVIVTNGSGCTATSTGITNTVLALPNPTLTSSDADNSFCSGTSVTFTAGGGTSYNFRVAGASVQSGASTTYTTTALTNLQVVDVIVTNAGGCTATSTGITNTVLALPTAITIDSITQPTCALATGSAALSGLPASGTWIITESIGSTTITGSGTTVEFNGLAAGSYTFTVTNDASCTSAASVNAVINIQPATPAAPTGNVIQAFCSSNNPTVADLVVTGTALLWYDAATAGNLVTGTTSLVDGTIYYASQTVGVCESTDRLAVTAVVGNVPATSVIAGNAIPLCAAFGEVYSVDPTPGSNYSWSVPADAVIGSGETGPDNNQITVNFGTKSGYIIVTETSSLGCQGIPVQLEIILQGCDLVADFSASKTSLCTNEEVIFTDLSQGTSPGTTYEWEFGNGAVPSSSTLSNPDDVSYTTPGMKTVRLVITNGLTDTLVKTDYIVVNPVPGTVIESADRCGPGSVDLIATLTNADRIDFSIDGGLTVAATDNSAPYVFNALPGTDETIQVMGRAYNSVSGCSGIWESEAFAIANPVPEVEKIATSHSGISASGYLDVVCSGMQNIVYSLKGESNATYNWNIPGLGITANGDTLIKVDWNVQGGDYVIDLEKISNKGCSATANILVLVSQPKPDLGVDVIACEGSSHTFSLTENYDSYKWNDGSTEPTLTDSVSGKIYVTVVDEYECEGTDTAELLISTTPIVDLGRDTTICGDNPIDLDAGDFSSYSWSTGETVNPITVREGAGTISVIITNADGCEGTDEIVINPCDPVTLLGVIPNTITPNDDGVHDSWKIDNMVLFPQASVQIYDRWGRVVFEQDAGYENDWEGKDSSGRDLPVDTYFYIIDLKVKGTAPIAGNVTIIR